MPNLGTALLTAVRCEYGIARFCGRLNGNPNPYDGIRILRSCAEHQLSAKACWYLGYALMYGIGVEKDLKHAARVFERGAQMCSETKEPSKGALLNNAALCHERNGDAHELVLNAFKLAADATSTTKEALFNYGRVLKLYHPPSLVMYYCDYRSAQRTFSDVWLRAAETFQHGLSAYYLAKEKLRRDTQGRELNLLEELAEIAVKDGVPKATIIQKRVRNLRKQYDERLRHNSRFWASHWYAC
eukprot:TRINITY_DN9574_c0_g1_i2.p1 TRINITY_DN9574_c0_g1~~TRINITY_DN9574_c0_g1_i2.p1  ORF type:complete len:243 (+),score=38.56 TRINITY_DN9574_c0_g1_i2:361-1089(+)